MCDIIRNARHVPPLLHKLHKGSTLLDGKANANGQGLVSLTSPEGESRYLAERKAAFFTRILHAC